MRIVPRGDEGESPLAARARFGMAASETGGATHHSRLGLQRLCLACCRVSEHEMGREEALAKVCGSMLQLLPACSRPGNPLPCADRPLRRAHTWQRTCATACSSENRNFGTLLAVVAGTQRGILVSFERGDRFDRIPFVTAREHPVPNPS